MTEFKITVDAPELANAILALAVALQNGQTSILEVQKPQPQAILASPRSRKAAVATVAADVKTEVVPLQPEVTQYVHEEPKVAEAPATLFTLAQVRERLAALSQSGKQVQVKQLITKHGAAKLTDIAPEKYEVLMQEASGL